MTEYTKKFMEAQNELNGLAEGIRVTAGRVGNEYNVLLYGRLVFVLNVLGAYEADACKLEMVAKALDDAERWTDGAYEYIESHDPQDAETFSNDVAERAHEIVSNLRDEIEDDVPRELDIERLLRMMAGDL